MKKLLTLALVLAVLAVFTGPGVAQQDDEQKGPTARDETTAAPTSPAPQEATAVNNPKRKSSRVAANVMTGKVTQVNEENKTFTVAVVISASNLSTLPAVGQVVDITYTAPPGGGPLEASNLNLSKSNIN